MFVLSQRDKRWSDAKIGKTDFTIGKLGCTITSICMLFTKFYRKELMPSEVSRVWSFDAQARLLWTKTKFDGMKFIWRGYDFDKAEIIKYASAKNQGVIVEVDKSHWCAVRFIIGGLIVLADPWYGDTLWYWGTRYKNITGYALFIKDEK